jgi:hypothetical protein
MLCDSARRPPRSGPALGNQVNIRKHENERISSMIPDDDNDESLILPPRDYSDIVKLQEPNVLDQFLEHPTTAALEMITGAFAGGGKGPMVSAGRIAQGLVKGQMYDVLADEIRRLREAGKLPDDLGSTKHGLHTWAELCAIIDDECPDADRLEALKAAFYAVNRLNQEDKDRNLAYQLWQVAKKLESADVILLKTMVEKEQLLVGVVGMAWANRAADFAGLQSELIRNSIEHLAKLRVVGASENTFSQAALNNLGQRMVQNIKTYEVDLDAAKRRKAAESK